MRASAGGRASQVGAEGGEGAAAGAGGFGGLDYQTLHCPLHQSSCRGAKSWVDPGRRCGRSDHAGSVATG